MLRQMQIDIIWIISVFAFVNFRGTVSATGLNDCPARLSRSQLYSYGNVCLQVSNEMKTWPKARQDCVYHGGDLVQIRDQDMQQFITQIVNRQYYGYWIGASDLTLEGHWIWVAGDKDLKYSNWSPKQGPSHTGGFLFGVASREDCAQIRTDDSFMWHDQVCDDSLFHSYSYICQYDKILPITTKLPVTIASSSQSTPETAKPTRGCSIKC